MPTILEPVKLNYLNSTSLKKVLLILIIILKRIALNIVEDSNLLIYLSSNAATHDNSAKKSYYKSQNPGFNNQITKFNYISTKYLIKFREKDYVNRIVYCCYQKTTQ
ncbi:uncharacterized protein ASCRUDRAFT_115847 [Ascoidea rubescens DSM 1968]|uniref:Uncharacterized protein n=1 Tax=Ascoidea rubescens DSM 1968 TaxID=1344418 RepID=A0A1D2VC58_9ASCO|nr:hypothetical protein ASCRUDRAFT_115847 [Ascoidea rubescens DSM 1968]ODV59067.1 hypothetical protein ASCRUDRAFT_115847 [Ascoidea rubescens DSM 1968]